jgi:predicted transcriptional regulator
MTESHHTPLSEVMSRELYVVDGLSSVAEAIALMYQRKVSSIVIDKRHENDEYGILVVHDIAKEIIGKDHSPERTNVYEIMSKPVLTLDVNMDIRYAVRMLTRFGLSRALVTNHGHLAGIVTLRDLVFRYLAVKGK